MKKYIIPFFSFFLFLTCCVGLTSCGGNEEFDEPGTEDQTGNSGSDNETLDVVAVYSHVGASADDVRAYMAKNYSKYELEFDTTPEWITDGNISPVISYTNSKKNMFVQYMFYEDKLLIGSVTYNWYNEENFKELLNRLSDIYSISIEKTGETTSSAGPYITYGGGRQTEDGVGMIAVSVSCVISSTPSESHMYYQVQSN